jgi:hypothetical protein
MTKYKWLGIAVLVAAVAGTGLTLRQAGAQCCGGYGQPAAKAKPAASQPASATAKFVNTRCPIMGGAIDPAKVPDNMVRTHKGQKVAFCCPMCLPKWDKLTAEQKDAKLKAAAAAKP